MEAFQFCRVRVGDEAAAVQFLLHVVGFGELPPPEVQSLRKAVNKLRVAAHRPRPARYDGLADASLADAASMGVLLLPIMAVGVYPKILTDVFDSGILPIIAGLG